MASDCSDVIRRTIEVIGNRREAMQWLGTPVRALGYATPIARLASEAGTEEVLNLLTALEHGVLEPVGITGTVGVITLVGGIVVEYRLKE
ncbi:MAG TPA: MbcA/ParS/Xre antitoxin family protein [Burkholderiales bacterium]|nr:MbcA/ParS/Xre antitoxin family protein [Burkholderiales bacterium]